MNASEHLNGTAWKTPSAYGWELVNTETTWKDARRSLREYRTELPGQYKAVKRRERIEPCTT